MGGYLEKNLEAFLLGLLKKFTNSSKQQRYKLAATRQQNQVILQYAEGL